MSTGQSRDSEAKQVPLIELLRSVPSDARLVIEDGPYSTRYIPVGRYCREAADALSPPPVEDVRAEFEADALRLDWLDATNKRFRMGWKVGIAPVGNISVQSVIFADKSKEPTTIREAIDAARASRRSDEAEGE